MDRLLSTGKIAAVDSDSSRRCACARACVCACVRACVRAYVNVSLLVRVLVVMRV